MFILQAIKKTKKLFKKNTNFNIEIILYVVTPLFLSGEVFLKAAGRCPASETQAPLLCPFLASYLKNI